MVPVKKVLQSQNWRVILVTIFITGILCSPIYYHRIAIPVDTDYGSHVLYTQDLLSGKGLDPLNLSHPVLELILAAMHLASGRILGLYASLMVLQVLVQIFTVLIIYFWIGKAERKYWDWLRASVAVSLTFVAPVMLLAFWDGSYYYGYIGLANYHNPTIHLLKPFALLSFMYASRAAAGERSKWGSIALAAFWMILSSWIKPNYTFAILPALGLVIGIRLWQRIRVDWKMMLFGFFLPGLLSLFFQWLIAYYYGDPGEGIIFAPFQVEGAYSHNLALKFFLSALFPLLILIIARRSLLKDSNLLVGWTGFLVGGAQFYLLAEGGERMLHGNFRWSGQIMLFLLFAVTARWLLKEKILAGRMQLSEKVISYSAYLAHLAGGVAYYIYCMTSIHYW
jgi:hypothetical protein